MLCVPTDRVLVVIVTEPPDSVPVPTVVPPSRKVTEPVAVPAPGAVALTLAVRVTVWPKTDGLADELIVVEVEALLTTWAVLADWLGLKLPSPEYSALMLCVPTDRVLVVK